MWQKETQAHLPSAHHPLAEHEAERGLIEIELIGMMLGHDLDATPGGPGD